MLFTKWHSVLKLFASADDLNNPVASRRTATAQLSITIEIANNLKPKPFRNTSGEIEVVFGH
jgi:hypothetical protein